MGGAGGSLLPDVSGCLHNQLDAMYVCRIGAHCHGMTAALSVARVLTNLLGPHPHQPISLALMHTILCSGSCLTRHTPACMSDTTPASPCCLFRHG